MTAIANRSTNPPCDRNQTTTKPVSCLSSSYEFDLFILTRPKKAPWLPILRPQTSKDTSAHISTGRMNLEERGIRVCLIIIQNFIFVGHWWPPPAMEQAAKYKPLQGHANCSFLAHFEKIGGSGCRKWIQQSTVYGVHHAEHNTVLSAINTLQQTLTVRRSTPVRLSLLSMTRESFRPPSHTPSQRRQRLRP